MQYHHHHHRRRHICSRFWHADDDLNSLLQIDLNRSLNQQ